MFCTNCGSQLNETEQICSGCVAPASQLNEQYCNVNSQTKKVDWDNETTLLKILSFFLPIVGIIIYFIEKDNDNLKAKACLKWALISYGVSVGVAAVGVIVELLTVFVFTSIAGGLLV